MGTYTILKPENISEKLWNTLVENFEKKVNYLNEEIAQEDSLYSIMGVDDSHSKFFYNKDTSIWCDSVKDATQYAVYQDALDDWFRLQKDKETRARFKRIVVQIVSSMLSEGLDDYYLKYYDGPGYYKFTFATTTPIETKTDSIEGQTVDIDEISMVKIESEKEFLDYVASGATPEDGLSREFFAAKKMKEFSEKKTTETNNDVLCEDTRDEFGAKSWRLNKLISSLNDENAYSGWIWIWPDGTEESDAKYYFDTEEDYNELLDTAKRIYKKYHDGGIYDADKDTIELAEEFDKELGLDPIDIL